MQFNCSFLCAVGLGLALSEILHNGASDCIYYVSRSYILTSETRRAEQVSMKKVSIDSWKTGGRKIREQSFTIKLSPSQKEYEASVKDVSGQDKYLLKAVCKLADESRIPYDTCQVTLQEIKTVSTSRRQVDNYNLLMVEKPVPSRDNILKEDSVGYFYPLEDVQFLKHGLLGYPISLKRVVKVEEFYCVMHAIEYKVNSRQMNKFDFLTLQITFSNKDG